MNFWQDEADADPAWYDHKCFVGMGDHYFQYDYTPDQGFKPNKLHVTL